MQERRARGPDGRDWLVRSSRFHRPPWRSLAFSEPGPGEYGCLGAPLLFFDMILAAVGAFFGVIVFPLLVFLVEAPMAYVMSLVSERRYVEASYEGAYVSRMRWRTSAERVDAVVDQIVRQLELGYERITPYGAEFLGFESGPGSEAAG